VTYYDELTRAMFMLSGYADTLFVGQSVKWKSNAVFNTLAGIAESKRIEIPVVEDFQAGFCLGLALKGYLPVCIYPRMDFMILACNQIVNHIDKLPYTSHKGRVIIRVGVGAKYPLDSGRQHTQDHSAAFRLMCRTTEVIELNSRFDVFKSYEYALAASHSCILIERQDLFNA
jgi:pyruvate/2-oxoglutarate/acetoin dehydrogenase E1 component